MSSYTLYPKSIEPPVHINDMNYEDLIHYNIFCKLLSEGKKKHNNILMLIKNVLRLTKINQQKKQKI